MTTIPPDDRLTALLRRFDVRWLPDEGGLAVDRSTRSGLVRICTGADERLATMIGVYRTERAGLLRFARSLLGRDDGAAEDLLQEVMRKVCQKPPTVQEPGRELAYLLQAVRNEASTIGGRAGRDRARRVDDPDAVAGVTDATAPFEDPVLFHLVVARALAALAPRQRALVELVDIRGLTVAQAAAELDIAVGTAKKHRFVALRRLRDDPALAELRDVA
ncbi:RNA polymerase sigma factor [Actinomycetospora termitidis]|uniref:Sigma-70 family RNA polymerase sigma factor n=1 Tax=Actinomycetospora termitidis TaxID=3053470 RepID=A0ABT7MEM6_9PSEU|nr:sigma-70 family RNA polymerase sigma factor [Actinomycetospora sp. Odt1-22]MDL5158906.1 sigma-70 family RNA polymerase sigma factor [Actinomycetospora sp. Odt1-22]